MVLAQGLLGYSQANQWGLLPSPDLTGAGKSSSKLTQVTVIRTQFFAVWTSPSDCLSPLGTWWLASPEQVIQAKEQACKIVTKREATVFYNLISEVTHHHFCHISLVTQTNTVQCKRGIHKGVNPRRQDHWRRSQCQVPHWFTPMKEMDPSFH